ncbi:MAG: methyltransferase family protein [Candidatus Thorarchaeota archaeon]
MKLRGIEKLREKLPEYSGWRLLLLPLRGVTACAIGLFFMVFLDTLPRVCRLSFLVLIEPLLPLIGSALCTCIGVLLVRGIWLNRDRWLRELDGRAYAHALRRGACGVFLIGAVVIHIYLSKGTLLLGPPANPLTILLSTSVLAAIGVPWAVDMIARTIGGFVLIALALATMRSAVYTFGIDYMLLMYLYFPEESDLQSHDIYSVIRHPAYFGAVLFALGGLLFRLSIYSVLLVLIVFAGLKYHVSIEERELIERFGESYREYMCQVPGLYVRPGDFRVFVRFLTSRGENHDAAARD